ncbi:hypothetical protein [Paenibacillus zanthoxyli]|uniref:hypothetical protein n=1 Tax=Paenibacillus zanthoxyli TaxID=369399 RepID=UPI001E44368C|nr:hypothetical protein [Paenibacillus zanthoxyli]
MSGKSCGWSTASLCWERSRSGCEASTTGYCPRASWVNPSSTAQWEKLMVFVKGGWIWTTTGANRRSSPL